MQQNKKTNARTRYLTSTICRRISDICMCIPVLSTWRALLLVATCDFNLSKLNPAVKARACSHYFFPSKGQIVPSLLELAEVNGLLPPGQTPAAGDMATCPEFIQGTCPQDVHLGRDTHCQDVYVQAARPVPPRLCSLWAPKAIMLFWKLHLKSIEVS